jgi:hypothetical protein
MNPTRKEICAFLYKRYGADKVKIRKDGLVFHNMRGVYRMMTPTTLVGDINYVKSLMERKNENDN